MATYEKKELHHYTLSEETLNAHFDKILSSLKIICNYEKMDDCKRYDFHDEINALFPLNYNEIIQPYSAFHAYWIGVNSLESRIFKRCFGEAWPLFIYLHINLVFTKENLYSREHEIKSLSYTPANELSSNVAFWNLVSLIKNFLALSNLNNSIKTRKLFGFLEKILTSLVSLGVITNRKVRVQITHQQLEYETIDFFYLVFPSPTMKSFTYENKISLSPPQIISFKELQDVKTVVFVKGHNLTKIEVEEVENYYTYVATHMRMERFTSKNHYGWNTFRFKKEIQESILNLPLYPDIKFINYLRNEMYSDLTEEHCNDEMKRIKLELDDSFRENYWTHDTQERRSKLQKEYSLALENLKKIKFLLNDWESSLQFIHFHDWRGRKMYASPVGFTSFKMARLCFHYGDGGVIGPEWEDWTMYESIIFPLKEKHELRDGDEIIAYLLMSIGKFDPERKGRNNMSCYSMMEKGLLYYSGVDPEIEDRDDLSAFLHVKFVLKEFLNGSKIKRMICKDATASGYMLQVGLMYAQSAKIKLPLIITNLIDDENFNDTYQWITSLVKENCDLSEKIDYLLTRKIMKPFYMIIPYSAGKAKCFSKIENFIRKEDDKKEIKRYFDKIWNFVNHKMWVLLGFENSFKEYVKENESNILESETAIADVSYFHMDVTRLDVETKGVRSTRTIKTPSAYLNKNATETGKSPNTIAFYESEIIRVMAENPWNMNIVTVHDAFFPSIFDCGKVVRCYGSFFYVKMGLTGKPPRTSLL